MPAKAHVVFLALNAFLVEAETSASAFPLKYFEGFLTSLFVAVSVSGSTRRACLQGESTDVRLLKHTLFRCWGGSSRFWRSGGRHFRPSHRALPFLQGFQHLLGLGSSLLSSLLGLECSFLLPAPLLCLQQRATTPFKAVQQLLRYTSSLPAYLENLSAASVQGGSSRFTAARC